MRLGQRPEEAEMYRGVHRIDATTYGVESPSGKHYAVVRNLACGNEPPRWTCSCDAGQRGQRCLHVVFVEDELKADKRRT